jgi:hypothetical protein
MSTSKARIILENIGEVVENTSDISLVMANVCRGSVGTGDVWTRRLNRFCELTNHTPKSLVFIGEKKAYDLMCDVVTDLEGKNYAPDYINGVVNVVAKSWLKHMGVRIVDRVNHKIHGSNHKKRKYNRSFF